MKEREQQRYDLADVERELEKRVALGINRKTILRDKKNRYISSTASNCLGMLLAPMGASEKGRGRNIAGVCLLTATKSLKV